MTNQKLINSSKKKYQGKQEMLAHNIKSLIALDSCCTSKAYLQDKYKFPGWNLIGFLSINSASCKSVVL